MSSIDERIVQMQFQNSQFEKGVSESLKSLEKLKEGLQLEKAAEGLKRLQEAGDSFSLASVSDSVDALGDRFSAFGTFAGRIIENLADTVYHKLGGAIESLTVGQISSGWQRYADDTKAVQTIMFATGKSIEEVETELERLTWFTDETSYSYTDMVGNISKFTSAGVDLDKARISMQGIATWAASAGQDAATASRVMYNASQALGAGAMKVADWKSIELANMATKEFKENVIQTAIAMGKLDANGSLLIGKGKKIQVTADEFRETLRYGWFDNDVMVSVFSQYGEYAEKVKDLQDQYQELYDIYLPTSEAMEMLSGTTSEFSEKAFKAAQEAKTFSEAIDALKDASTTKWMRLFKLIFGDYEHAKDLWTKLANDLYTIFVDPLDELVETFKEWHKVGDDGLSSWDNFMAGIYDIMDGLKGILVTVRDALSNLIPGLTIDSLHSFSESVRDFGAAFKAAFGLPDEDLGAIELINGVGDAVKDVNNIVNSTTSSSGRDIKFLKAEAVQLQNALKQGASGKEVKKMQEQLLGAGYSLDQFGADGIWGPETQAAWEAFCKDAGLGIDSVFDEAASQSLADAFNLKKTQEEFEELHDSMKLGDRGDEVKRFQERLMALGFNLDKFGADGIWGPETQRAWEQFCEAYGLDPTQEYDQKAHLAMKQALGYESAIEAAEELVEKTDTAVDATEKYGNKLDQIKMIFGGIAAAGGIVLKIVGFIKDVLVKVWDITAPLRNAFMIAGAAIGEALINFNNWLGTSGAIEKWSNSVQKFLEPVAKWIEGAADSFLVFFGLKKPAEESGKEVKTFASVWKGLVDKVKKTAIFQNIVTAFNSIKAAIDKIRPSLKKAKDSFKKNLGSGLTTVLKVLGGALLVVLAPIGVLIGLLGKLVGFIISYIPKGIEVLKGFWKSLTFEGDESLGKAPGILTKAKNFLKSISDFLFGSEAEDGTKKVGIFSRIGALLRGDMAGFTEGLSEEDAAKAIEFSEKIKGIYETIKSNIDKAFAVLALLFTGNQENAVGLSSDIINRVNDVRTFFNKIGEAIQYLFGGEDTKTSLISEETKSKINEFKSGVLRVFNTIRDAIVSVGEGIWFLFGGQLSDNKTISDGTLDTIQRFKNKLSEVFGLIYILFTGNKKDGATDWKRWATKNELGVLEFRNTILGYFDKVKGVFATIGAVIRLLFTGSDDSGLISDSWKDRIIWFRDKCISIFDSIRDNLAKAWPRIRLLFTGDDKNTTLDEKDAKAVLDFRDKIIGFFQNVGSTFKKIWAVISYLFTGKGADGVLSDETVDKLQRFKDWVSTTFETVKKSLGDIWESVKDVFKNGFSAESLKNAFITIWEKLKEFFNSLGNTAKNILKWGLIGFILYKVVKFIGNITGLIGNLKDGIKAFKGDSESLSDKVLKFAGAIAIISASIWLLSTQITKDQLNQGLTAFGWIIGAIAGFMILSAVFSRKKPGKDASTLSDAVWDIAKSIGVLTAAIWFLGKAIDWGTFMDGLGKTAVIMLVLGGFILGLKALEKKMGNSMSLSLEGKIWQLAIIIGAMALVVRLLGGMDIGKAAIGVGALAGIMISLGLFMRLASKYGQFKMKGFISLSIAVGIIAIVIKRLSKLSPGQALQGVGSVAIILSLIALIARSFGKYGDQIKVSQMLSMFLGIAAVIGLFGYVVSKIKDVNPGVMISFSGSLALALGAFVAACLIVGKTNQSAGDNTMINGALSIVGALFAFAATAVVLVGALGFLDRALGGGAQDAFAKGAEILKITAGAIKGFLDALGADFSDVIVYLGASEIVGFVNQAADNNTMLNGAWSIIGALLSFAVACLILVGGIGGLDEIDKEHSLKETFQNGSDILIITAGAVKGFMDTLDIHMEDLALLLGGSAVIGYLGLGGQMLTGAFFAGLAIDAFIGVLEAFVGVNGIVNKLTNGGWEDAIKSGGDVLHTLGGAIASFITGGLDEFTRSINDFASAIGTLRDSVDGISKDQDIQSDIDKSLGIAGQIYGFFTGVNDYKPDPTGVQGYNTAAEGLSSDIGTFGENIKKLWDGITGISKDKDIDNDVQKSITVASTLKTQFFDVVAAQMPSGAGLKKYNDKITKMLDRVKQFAENMGIFHTNISGFYTPTIEKDTKSAIDAAEAVRGFLAHLKETNGEIELNKQGISAWFGEETNAETVFDSVNKLAESIGNSRKSFSGIIGSSLEKDVTSAVNIAKSVGELLVYLNREEFGSSFNGRANLERMNWLFDPEDEDSLVSMLKGFGEQTRDITNIDDISGIFNGFASIASYLSSGEQIQTDFKSTGLDMATYILEGFMDFDVTQLSLFVATLVSRMKDARDLFVDTGVNFVGGLVEGIANSAQVAYWAVEAVAKNMIARVRGVFDEHSPSKVATQIGEYFTEGLAKGVTGKETDALSSTQTVAENMIDVAQGTLMSLSQLLAQDIDVDPVITPVVDLTNARESAATISSLFGTQESGINVTRNLANRMNYDGTGEVVMRPEQISAENLSILKTDLETISRGLDSMSNSDVVDGLNTMSDNFADLSEAVRNMKLVLDTGALVGGTSAAYDREFGLMTGRRERGN